jgi:3',5'-cyclic AMP phosphodiesterase CpdA
MLKLAHLSDPHINLKYHPDHLSRLELVLRDAIEHRGADHVVISGDITSNADQRDLLAVRELFQRLDIFDASKLTLVVGNHDIFGGPHLADEVLSFPKRCQKCSYDEKLAFFQQVFKPLFAGCYMEDEPYPFIKKVKGVALVGLNSVARHSQYRNPVGSNGEIDEQQYKVLTKMLSLPMVRSAKQRVAVLHHHLFRRKDEKHLHSYSTPSGLFSLIEQETLKLRKKRRVIAALKKGDVQTVLHGHVHFTGDYPRKSLRCYNGAGAIFPLLGDNDLSYNLLTIAETGTSLEVPVVQTESITNYELGITN